MLRHFAYMAVDAPKDIRDAVGLDDAVTAEVRERMLAGRMDDAAALLPDAMVDLYAVSGTHEEIATAIAEQRANFDLFMVPMNDEETSAEHIRECARIIALT